MVKKEKDKTTEEKILDAARKVFIRKGMDGARMQDIADEAGINKALLHYYFRTKDKLFEVIFKETAGKLFPKFELILNSDISYFDKLRKIVESYMDMINENPYMPLFVLNEMNRNNNIDMHEFFKKQRAVVIEKFVQLTEREIAARRIKKISGPQLLVNTMSMCIFPFIGRPIITALWQMDELEFKELINRRKKDVADFVIDSIKK